jgi:hypothetical protein
VLGLTSIVARRFNAVGSVEEDCSKAVAGVDLDEDALRLGQFVSSRVQNPSFGPVLSAFAA